MPQTSPTYPKRAQPSPQFQFYTQNHARWNGSMSGCCPVALGISNGAPFP
jgi:hypothetical protein